MAKQDGLPVGVAAFVGRSHERARVAGLVADARVVTLTGSGGCGKTRLATEVAGDVAPRFPDGAGWVDLPRSRGTWATTPPTHEHSRSPGPDTPAT